MQLIPNLLIIPVGIIIGVLVAAPVGPVNVLCIQRAIERGFWGGIAAGLGAVLGDGLIALSAALGVGAISGAIEYHRSSIQVVGGLALLAFGAKLYLSPPRLETLNPDVEQRATLRDYAWDIPQTFFLTITNPGAVLGLFAIFGGVSTFVEVHSYIDALTMVASIMGGSLMWWIGLANLIGRVRHRLDPGLLAQMNRVAGILLMGFGVLLVGEIVFSLLRG
jgi:threonine/homoserine/homoserine lactone efflux protein